jgi:flavodoxin
MSKILIIYCSRPQTQNTHKIAHAMINGIQADITTLDNVNNYDIEKYDLVGFGSGVFF